MTGWQYFVLLVAVAACAGYLLEINRKLGAIHAILLDNDKRMNPDDWDDEDRDG